MAVERDLKPRNMNFAKVDKRGGGVCVCVCVCVINREGVFIRINTVSSVSTEWSVTSGYIVYQY